MSDLAAIGWALFYIIPPSVFFFWLWYCGVRPKVEVN